MDEKTTEWRDWRVSVCSCEQKTVSLAVATLTSVFANAELKLTEKTVLVSCLYLNQISTTLHSQYFWLITVCPAEPPSICVQLLVCPACLCTEPECRLPPAGPSGSPGAHQTKSTLSLGLSAQPASTALLWVCLVLHSAAPLQNR